MKQRVITAVFGFAVLIPVLLFSGTLVLPVAVSLFSVLGVYEVLGCIGVKKKMEIVIPSLIVAFMIPFLSRYISKISGRNSFNLALIGIILYIFLFLLMSLAVMSKGTKSVFDMAFVFMMTAYVTVGFTSIIMLRDLPHGEYLYLLIFIGAWVTDGAAYFIGRAFGKHKLIPDVSPKKTIEGAVGGTVFCMLAFLVFGIIVSNFNVFSVRVIEILLAGFIISVISIFGDLIASLIKRHYGIKDYGNLFPGHGGVMDRFDSIIAIAPFLLMICSYPNVFALFY